jgi:hypothetical protein
LTFFTRIAKHLPTVALTLEGSLQIVDTNIAES